MARAPFVLLAHALAGECFVGAWWLSPACACAAVWQPLFTRRRARRG